MRHFIIFSMLLLAGVQESNAWIIYSAKFKSVDAVRDGYASTSKTTARMSLAFTSVEVEMVIITCSGVGREKCPTSVGPADYSNHTDAAHVNNLSRYAMEQTQLGKASGAHSVVYYDEATGKSYRYTIRWETEGEQIRTTIDKEELL
ncbi:MAG: hypothetical protein KJS92_01145 [Bacteroidetes bacterium]|nr:hypothetical protein [Bacteroidota bacterium]